MEFLDKFGDWFTAFTAWFERFVTRLFGSSNERRIRKIGYSRDKSGNEVLVPGSTLDRINQLEPQYQQLTDEELKQTAEKLRARMAEGETLEDVLPDAFAAVRESGWRFLKMRHYNVQMVGGDVLHHRHQGIELSEMERPGAICGESLQDAELAGERGADTGDQHAATDIGEEMTSGVFDHGLCLSKLGLARIRLAPSNAQVLHGIHTFRVIP